MMPYFGKGNPCGRVYQWTADDIARRAIYLAKIEIGGQFVSPHVAGLYDNLASFVGGRGNAVRLIREARYELDRRDKKTND